MRVIAARNVHAALPLGLDYLERSGVEQHSRNGTVVVASEPVCTVYEYPNERVLFWADRDANPFFHFFEGLWMLAGRNDLEFLTQFVPRMKDYSDDGRTLHGAYGYRWRQHFEVNKDRTPDELPAGRYSMDQLLTIIAELKDNPDSRRCVLQMWDAPLDLARDGKDLPCNTQAYFLVREGHLDMTVCCRSNDMILGAYGANAVHFSMLQEFMAAGMGVEVGRYYQISNNFHAYHGPDLEKVAHLSQRIPSPYRMPKVESNPYEHPYISAYPMVSTPIEQWLQDLDMFLDEGVVVGLRDKFFRRVATPLFMAHRAFKENQGELKYSIPTEILGQCQAEDWRRAAMQWISRRKVKWLRAQDDGPTEASND